MITHEIKVYGETKKKSYLPALKRLNKDELKKYIEDTGFAIGMYITATKGKIRYLSQVEYVVNIQDDPEEIQYRYGDGDPMCLILMTAWNASRSPWVRADTIVGYRRLTEQEYKEIVEPEHDNIQNHIEHWKKGTAQYSTNNYLDY